MSLRRCAGEEAVWRATLGWAASAGSLSSPVSGGRSARWLRYQHCVGCSEAGAFTELRSASYGQTYMLTDAPFSAPCVAVRNGSIFVNGYPPHTQYSSGAHPSCGELPPNSGTYRYTYCHRVTTGPGAPYYVYPEMAGPTLRLSVIRLPTVTRLRASARVLLTPESIYAYADGTSYQATCQHCDGTYFDCSYPHPDDVYAQYPLGVPWPSIGGPTSEEVAAILFQTTQEVGTLEITIDLGHVLTDVELDTITFSALRNMFNTYPWSGVFSLSTADVACEGRSGSDYETYKALGLSGTGLLARHWPTAYPLAFGGSFPLLQYEQSHWPACGPGVWGCCTQQGTDWYNEDPTQVWVCVSIQPGTTYGKHASCWY